MLAVIGSHGHTVIYEGVPSALKGLEHRPSENPRARAISRDHRILPIGSPPRQRAQTPSIIGFCVWRASVLITPVSHASNSHLRDAIRPFSLHVRYRTFQ